MDTKSDRQERRSGITRGRGRESQEREGQVRREWAMGLEGGMKIAFRDLAGKV